MNEWVRVIQKLKTELPRSMRLVGSLENDFLLEMCIVENYFEFRNVRRDDQLDQGLQESQIDQVVVVLHVQI